MNKMKMKGFERGTMQSQYEAYANYKRQIDEYYEKGLRPCDFVWMILENDLWSAITLRKEHAHMAGELLWYAYSKSGYDEDHFKGKKWSIKFNKTA